MSEYAHIIQVMFIYSLQQGGAREPIIPEVEAIHCNANEVFPVVIEFDRTLPTEGGEEKKEQQKRERQQKKRQKQKKQLEEEHENDDEQPIDEILHVGATCTIICCENKSLQVINISIMQKHDMFL